jgi:hypothetical protein
MDVLIYKPVKYCGELGIEFRNIEGAGARVTKDFLIRLLNKVVRNSAGYYFGRGGHIFIFRERQLHSVICPSIADMTSVYVMEHPLERKPAGEEEYQGHVDYWISYRNYSFLMELKHCYFAYRVETPRQSMFDKLTSAKRQLTDIRKDQRRELTEKNKGLIGVALEAVTFFKSSTDSNLADDLGYQDFKELFDVWMDDNALNSIVNFRSLWILDQDLVEPVDYGDRYEIYPAIAFIGNISVMI